MASSHTSRDFEAELRELRAHTLAMGARCERSLRLALEAFWGANNTAELAGEVEEIDRHIDRDEMDIDALVLRILAQRQPVAYDLRFVAAALKLVTDLERIGDEAVNISERAREGRGVDEVRPQLKAMSEEAQEMLRGALDAFVEGESSRAEQVLLRDDSVDEKYGAILRSMMAFMAQHPDEIPSAIRSIKVAKYIERVADHATNIAEEVIFMVRGDDVRHVRTHPPPKTE